MRYIWLCVVFKFILVSFGAGDFPENTISNAYPCRIRILIQPNLLQIFYFWPKVILRSFGAIWSQNGLKMTCNWSKKTEIWDFGGNYIVLTQIGGTLDLAFVHVSLVPLILHLFMSVWGHAVHVSNLLWWNIDALFQLRYQDHQLLQGCPAE